MGQDFYILHEGQQVGPYSADQLAASGVSPDSLVWSEGMAEWTQANRVPALAAALYAVAAPQYQEPATVAYESAPVASRPSRVAPGYPGIVSGAFVLRVIGLIFIVIGGLFIVGSIVLAIAAQTASAVRSSSDGPGPSVWLAVAPAVFGGVMSIGYGLLFMFVGSVGLAVRDIARNSFK